MRFIPLLLVFVALLIWMLVRPVTPAPGVLAPEAPRQETVTEQRTIRHRGYRLTPVATFDATARVLSKRRYRDERAPLAPYDLAIGWGPMSDTAILDQMTVVQSNRVYTWRGASLPIAPKDIVRNSTNAHIIPADADVAAAMTRLRAGEVVELRGRLVDVVGTDGSRWRTSRSRTDHGVGACEIVWVEELKVSDG